MWIYKKLTLISLSQKNNNNPPMEGAFKHLWFHLFIVLSSFTFIAQSSDDCVYTVYVRTGSIFKAGTDSILSLRLYDVFGEMMEISDLEAWGGLMGPGYNYFERGNLDIFSGRCRCLSAPVCAMNLTSDGSGPHHGWYSNYVEVTTTGAHIPCAQTLFTVEQWLATDTSPYELTAIRNYCPDGGAAGGRDGGDDHRDDGVIKSTVSAM